MSNAKNQKDITPQEASAWLQILITLGSFIKSIFTKKVPKDKKLKDNSPTIHNSKDTLKNQLN